MTIDGAKNVDGCQVRTWLALLCSAILLAVFPAARRTRFRRARSSLWCPSPRGVADLHARPLALAMERILKQPCVINKPAREA